MKRYTFTEAFLGAIVLILGIVFGIYATVQFNPSAPSRVSYEVRFGNVAGVRDGQSVMLGGAKVGKVTKITFDRETYDAVVDVAIDKSLTIPIDSTIAILSSGVLGGKYLAIVPGHSKETFKKGDTIVKVEDSQSLEELIARAIFAVSDKVSQDYSD